MKPIAQTVTLQTLVQRTLSRLFKSTVLISSGLIVVAAISIGWFILRPSLNELNAVKSNTTEALVKRNNELVRTSVEQAAGNINRILGSAESALSDLISATNNFRSEVLRNETFPLEREFFPGGKLINLLGQQQGYTDPVTFESPQIKLNDQREITALEKVWKQFGKTTKRLHSQDPDLKWIYLGTQFGNFMVFPSSPMIPKDFDPRTRPWFQSAMKENKTVWVSPYFTAGGNDLVLTVASPISNTSIMSGAVAGVDVVMSDIVSNLLTTPYCDKCVFYLINDKREIIGKRGSRIQGKNWEQVPAATPFLEDLSKMVSGDRVTSLLESAFDPKTYAIENNGLSRASKAVVISKPDDAFTLFSAPINRLNWKLIGVVPSNYVGADGESVVKDVNSVVSKSIVQFGLLLVALLLFIVATIYFMFRVARLSVQKNLSPAIEQFSRLSSQLDNIDINAIGSSGHLPNQGEKSKTEEYRQISGAINRLEENIKARIKEREQLLLQAELGRLASQVAHDIRSPLASLAAMEQDLSVLPEDTRVLARKAINRIKDIANNLLQQNKKTEKIKLDDSGKLIVESSKTDDVHAITTIESVVSELRKKYFHLKNILIEEIAQPDVQAVFFKANQVEFQRLTSNLVNNAVEACGENGIISVSLKSNSGKIRIVIKDNGKGIPANVLPQLGELGKSFDKDGNGIGLFHAKQCVERWGGSLKIESVVQQGTWVTIEIPVGERPEWFCEEIRIAKGTTVLALDDDESVHSIWDRRFENIKEVKLIHFNTLSALKDWIEKAKSKIPFFVLCDFELKGDEANGIEIIRSLSIESRSVLVTSRADEDRVVAMAKQHGIKILPKQMAATVPFIIADEIFYDLALIDDDELVRATWKLRARDLKKKIAVFENMQDFLDARIAPNTPIYIDYHLQSELTGIDVASILKTEGYESLNLATGDESLTDLPSFIRSVNGKEFPLAN